ncbi:hypothetical protein TGP89_234180 [Toxoplasma gondii p89]|uniref:Uncharacterized protein n=1 Tax=Toxoplasma gondii p89 TaxID=943119 RepID=A0A086JZL8_TOXGO|nr:hypothetical protein TGP89_234180 [Toxoplasma gondii p89]
MGCAGSKSPVSTPSGRQGQIQRKRKEREKRGSKVPKDAVQQTRPTRFFGVTKTSVVATVAVDRKSIIRAYLEPDGGGTETEGIEVECEPDADHYLLFDDLKPGTVYRLKLFYVVPEKHHLGNMLAAMLRGKRTHDRNDAMQETAVKVRRGSLVGVHGGDVFGRRKIARGMTPRPGMKCVAMLPNSAQKLKVRTLPVERERMSVHLISALPPRSFSPERCHEEASA